MESTAILFDVSRVVGNILRDILTNIYGALFQNLVREVSERTVKAQYIVI